MRIEKAVDFLVCNASEHDFLTAFNIKRHFHILAKMQRMGKLERTAKFHLQFEFTSADFVRCLDVLHSNYFRVASSSAKVIVIFPIPRQFYNLISHFIPIPLFRFQRNSRCVEKNFVSTSQQTNERSDEYAGALIKGLSVA